MLDRIAGILTAPDLEWSLIAREHDPAWTLLARYVAIPALIPTLAHFIGASVVGRYAPITTGLAGALVIYAAAFVAVGAVAVIIQMSAPAFGAEKSFPLALRLAVYSAMPVWLAGIALVVPGLSFLAVLGLYGAYVLWSGLPILMRAPATKALTYAAQVTVSALVIVLALGVLVARL